jgi:S-ribosylhomocysteine lyase
MSNDLIPSFEIDHDILEPGIYVSRKDTVGKETLTTFDIRLKKPNIEPVIDNPAIHTMEHL